MYLSQDFDSESFGCEIQQKIKKFAILIDFNKNLMIFQIKLLDLNNEFFHNHASKKYEIIFLEYIMKYTSQKYIQKNFTTHSRNDFDF